MQDICGFEADHGILETAGQKPQNPEQQMQPFGYTGCQMEAAGDCTLHRRDGMMRRMEGLSVRMNSWEYRETSFMGYLKGKVRKQPFLGLIINHYLKWWLLTWYGCRDDVVAEEISVPITGSLNIGKVVYRP